MSDNSKPLGRKAYGSIGHLPTSRLGPKERHVHEGQARICTEKKRDKHDTIIVTEKLDGTNVAVANVDGTIVPLNRAGWPAVSAPREMHRLFAAWAFENQSRFLCTIPEPGMTIHGEWLAQAHGTLYDLVGDPFVVFDVTRTGKKGARERLPYSETWGRCDTRGGFSTPRILSWGDPVSIEDIRKALEIDRGYHGVRDGELMEGAVWRVERRGEFDFLAKWVNQEKVDGKYLPEQHARELKALGMPLPDPIWLWRPTRDVTSDMGEPPRC